MISQGKNIMNCDDTTKYHKKIARIQVWMQVEL